MSDQKLVAKEKQKILTHEFTGAALINQVYSTYPEIYLRISAMRIKFTS